jgi:sodium transport system permease protein
MRPSVLLLIAGKEIRDLIRDRRTVMLIIVLPALLYPLFGAAGYVMAQTLLGQTTRVGIAGLDRLPAEPALVRDGEFRYQGTATGDDGAEKSTGKFSVAALDGDANEALREKRFDLAILVPENFRQTIADPKLSPR